GARRVYLIEEPVAAAMGAGMDISKPEGNMVVDVGGGTTDIAVVSLGGVVASDSIKVAGDKFDEAVIKFIRRKYNILIGDRTAEELKISIGCLFPRPEETSLEVKGRCLITGLPRTVTVTSTEMIEALSEPAALILEAMHSVLERTPPELVGDISRNGIVLTGGGSLVWGFDRLIESRTGIETHVADDAVSCVAYGIGKSLDTISEMQDGTINISRKKQLK
ncbi:MAG: rod shape-determining protein, partial [Oscillospiraceae bacterium]